MKETKKEKISILRSFKHFLIWSLVILAFIGFLSVTGIFYVRPSYGVSTGEWDILSLNFFSRFNPTREGGYASYKRGDESIFHKIKEINEDSVTFETYSGIEEIVDKELIEDAVLFEIPIVRGYGKKGFLSACYYEYMSDDYIPNCEYMYCVDVEKEKEEICYEKYYN